MDFGFENVEEAFFTDLLAGFGAFEDRSGFCAEGAELGSHCTLVAGEVRLEGWEDPRKSDRAEEKRVRVMTRSAQKTFSPPESGDSVDNVECLKHWWLLYLKGASRDYQPFSGAQNPQNCSMQGARTARYLKHEHFKPHIPTPSANA